MLRRSRRDSRLMKDSSRPPDTPRPDYGLDAPDAVRRFLTIGTLAIVVSFAAPSLVTVLPPVYAQMLLGTARSLGWMGYAFVATACVMLWGSTVGKRRLRDKLLAAMPWRGDEQVLDVGCGRGLWLIGAAQRLNTGRAVGVDIWRAEDQARNRPEAALRNAGLEGVAERVEVRSADARRLPFSAASFDVVLSGWALHCIAERDGRRRAVEEIARVLKPGGRVLLVDVRYGAEYAALLRELGFTQVRLGPPNFLFVLPTRAVTALKAP